MSFIAAFLRNYRAELGLAGKLVQLSRRSWLHMAFLWKVDLPAGLKYTESTRNANLSKMRATSSSIKMLMVLPKCDLSFQTRPRVIRVLKLTTNHRCYLCRQMA